MLCTTLESTDPYFNLAIEEVLLKSSTEEYLILGINSPSVIIGKHQCPHMETDTKFITENDIPVIRRLSGGGTVFHDYGNLNFTFIRKSEPGKQVDFRKYTRPVIDFLDSLGVEAQFEGKNDLKVGGFKISGNAEHVHRNRVLHHGTLLYSSSLATLGNTLRKDYSCYSSRAVRSNPSSVLNLNEILGRFQNISEFRNEMMNYMIKIMPRAQPFQLSDSETEAASDLADSKYNSWEWNYAYGPEYHFENSFKINGSNVTCRMFVKDGIIRESSITGPAAIGDSDNELTGCRHMVADLLKVLKENFVLTNDNEVFNFF